MIIQTLYKRRIEIFIASLLLLFLSIICGCNRVIFVPDGSSVRILQDINNVKAVVLVDKDKRIYKTGRVNLKAGGYYVYLQPEESINGD